MEIEELGGLLHDIAVAADRASYRAVKRRVAAAPKPPLAPAAEPVAASSDYVAPGAAAVHVRTWGCSHNSSDGEYMMGILADHGYRLTADARDADVWVLVSCTVKNPSEQTFANDVHRARALGKRLVLAGCVPQGSPRHPLLDGLSVIGVHQIEHIAYVVEETLKGHAVRLLDMKRAPGSKRKLGGAPLDMPKIRKNPLIEIVPINTGCLNACTYCKTRHARGELASYPPDEIVARVRSVLDEGVVEIWLTSEDAGTYGRDIGTSLPELIERIVHELPAYARLRVGMTNPPYILEHLPRMRKLLMHDRVYAFLHVPVQSGADPVLAAMRRQYTRAEFEQVVDSLLPNVHIATDIIAGFPTESDADFDESLDLVNKYRFPTLHISQFYPRPGTPAARLPKLPTEVVKHRSRAMTQLFYSYEPFADAVGSEQRVLVTQVASDRKHLVAHDKAYRQVLVPLDPTLLGRMVDVQITSAGKFYLMGEVLHVLPGPSPPADAVAQILSGLMDTLAADTPEDGGDEQCDADAERDLTSDSKPPTEPPSPSKAPAPPSSEAPLPSSEASRLPPSDPSSSLPSRPVIRQSRWLLVVALMLLAVAVTAESNWIAVAAFLGSLVAFFMSIRGVALPVTQFKKDFIKTMVDEDQSSSKSKSE